MPTILPSRLPARPTPIGIDLGAAAIHAAQTDSAGRIVASCRLTRESSADPVGPADARRIAGAIRRRGFRGTDVTLTVPKAMLRTAMIDLPPASSGAPIAQIARAELARLHQLPPKSFECVWWSPAGAGPIARAHATTLTCTHADAGALIDAFAAEDLDVRNITPAIASAAHAAANASAATPVLMLDLGWTNATAAVVHAGRVLFERAVPRAGFRGVHDDWKQRCGVDDSVARWMLEEGRAEHARIAASVAKVIRPFGRTLASELNATCNYARQCWPNARFNTVYLVGGGARDNELAEWLGASLGFQFEQLAIEDTAGRRLGPGFAAAFGLATATTAPAKAAEPLLETGAAA